jgi:polysaccharide export outer membrane protein|tara:strand:- start:50729 stop:51835 length:1107 start_codon:yes stop_codon:yes gene_type:complete
MTIPARPLLLVTALLLGACATMPTAGPTAKEVLDEEAAAAASIGYRIIDLDTATMPPPPDRAADLSSLAALAAGQPGPQRIGQGDILQVTLYEVGAALFSRQEGIPAAGFDSSAKARPLGALEVAADGTIPLPFAGEIKVGGLTQPEAAKEIEAAYRGLSQEPQAQVTISRNLTNTVMISGLVGRPGRLDLSAAAETLSDALALTGAPTAPAEQVRLRFTRNNETVEVPLSALSSGSTADLRLMQGDRIELLPDRRSLTAFGGLNSVREIPFETETVTLAEAVARAGGPSEAIADPSAVFVFRDDPAGPAIYRVDLLRPSGYFLAQRFFMRDKDLIYVATASANRPSKLVDVINRLFTPVFTIREITR